MPVSCFNCSAKTQLHVLPQTQASRWLDVIPNIEKDKLNHINFRLCSAHFDDKYFTKTGRLFWNAVPTKFYINGVWMEINEITDEIDYKETELPVVTTDHYLISETTDGVLTVIRSSDSEELELQSVNFRYVGDINPNTLYSPKAARCAINLCKTTVKAQRTRIKKLLGEINMLKRQISDMNNFLDRLERDRIIKNRPIYKNKF